MCRETERRLRVEICTLSWYNKQNLSQRERKYIRGDVMAYDVFISFKNTAPGGGLTVDRTIAERLHLKLRDEGLEVFFSEKDLSNAAFMDQIYQALDEADLLILVGTSTEYINSRWVKSEWSTFFGSIQSGRKENGHIITVLHGITTRDLPIQLEHFESFGANDLDSAVEFAFRTLGKVRKSEAAARIAEEQERQRKAAEEAAVLEMQKRMEAERQAEKDRAAAEKKRQKALAAAERERQRRINAEKRAAEAQKHSEKQAGQNRWLKIAAVVLCAVLLVGGAVGVGSYVKQQQELERIAEEQRVAELESIFRSIKDYNVIAYGADLKAVEEQRLLDEQRKAEIEKGITYGLTLASDGMQITRFGKADQNVTLPDKYFDRPVTSIGVRAFYDNENLTSVTIPDSIIRIERTAFGWCKNLTAVTIPDSVTYIGENAFAACEKISSLNIGNSVISMGRNAFAFCDSLTSVEIPDSVTGIGESAFMQCNELTSVSIGDGVTTIEDHAFQDCPKLTSVTLGDSVTSIGGHAFKFCYKLNSITIPDSMTSIGEWAFYGSTINITAPHEPHYYGYTPDGGVNWIVKKAD